MRSPPVILIIEDTPANLEIMEIRLRANNYEVITAKDGEEGLAMAREFHPDLILLDILMPKMDGLEVCRRIKSDSSLPFMPIIIVTAKTDSKDIVAGLEIGADDYLTKPVNHTALVARVKSMLRIKELHDTVLEQSTRLKQQLRTAAKIQALFWPQIEKQEGDTHIWGVSVPASYVGGDLYDVIPMADGSFIGYVADVSDKGVPAALIMAALSMIIRDESQRHDTLASLLDAVNRSLCNLVSEEGYFATIGMARYWPGSGRLKLLRAGHPYPLHIFQGRISELPPLQGIAIGIDDSAPYEDIEISLSANESILLYSDGVLEAANESSEEFGEKRIAVCIESSEGPPWGKGLLEAVRQWQGNSAATDDITLLEIWRK